MKKLSTLFVFITSLFAASNTEISDFYSQSIKSVFPNAKISIGKRQKVGDTGFESVVVEIETEGQKQEDILFTKDSIITPEIIDLKAKISYRQEYEREKFQKARQNFTKNAKSEAQKESMVIALGDKNKPAIYVFSDPECPYCRQHLANITEELKNYQVNYILTPVHGRSAFEKSALIYKESKKAKSDKEKIAILNKYYNPDIKNYPAISDDEVQAVFKLYEKYRSLGLSATPTIIK
ncbi:thioredoxin fold domain-containing protein [Campylobacter sp. MIT 21-1685]|uniref:bifunctional thiol oxidoreductase n=1 Tax=unclassified Campylobacter TaxID=2593542 RepID=UPI00224A8F63|nr:MULTISPECIES: thioredoxin fold domain-containing protein [unclassified Campylobacter]MCX2683183.1 thioredoxin fold domain-containing protein [Campylobacter sp. MIT 21-1684]MCX2751497.1 thioredoxin fold domain-containing protein [Campylobacter sp. MIT 21-1682]MCX2807664.1 thioredoxin fold domain-containing protein [Campylobacter sp. MIT 21-1685]